LLSVVDHYARVAKDTKKRVVGVLLGEIYKGTVDVSNCYAGPAVFNVCVVFFSSRCRGNDVANRLHATRHRNAIWRCDDDDDDENL
jgi:hypothetical protein